MSIDPTRATFVLSEWRYEKAEDQSVYTLYPTQARVIQIQTNLSSADAAALAATYLADTKGVQQAFQIDDIEGVFYPSDFAGSAPRFTLSLANYATDNRPFKVVSISSNYANNRSNLLVRG